MKTLDSSLKKRVKNPWNLEILKILVNRDDTYKTIVCIHQARLQQAVLNSFHDNPYFLQKKTKGYYYK